MGDGLLVFPLFLSVIDPGSKIQDQRTIRLLPYSAIDDIPRNDF